MKSSPTHEQPKATPQHADVNKATRSGRSKGESGKKGRDGWSDTEEESFFVALKKHGRNFDKISTLVSTKDSEQVRHFYYRMVKKINTVLGDANPISDKKSKEQLVVALLCYWELRKSEKQSNSPTKVQCVVKPPSEFANDLRKSITTALTNAGLLVAPLSIDSLSPAKITLQLLPKETRFADILTKAGHNPRLQLIFKPHKTIAFVINHITKKWIEGKNVSLWCPIRLYPRQTPTIDPNRFNIGWGEDDAITVTALDVFRSLGAPDILKLYYQWDQEPSPFSIPLSLATPPQECPSTPVLFAPSTPPPFIITDAVFTPTIATPTMVGSSSSSTSSTPSELPSFGEDDPFFVQVHDPTAYGPIEVPLPPTQSPIHPLGASVVEDPSPQIVPQAPKRSTIFDDSSSASGFADEASTDGFGNSTGEERAAQAFYKRFESSSATTTPFKVFFAEGRVQDETLYSSNTIPIKTEGDSNPAFNLDNMLAIEISNSLSIDFSSAIVYLNKKTKAGQAKCVFIRVFFYSYKDIQPQPQLPLWHLL